MPYVNSNGCRIWWEEQGRGEPVLAIMGLGFSREMWYRTTPALASHFRMILFDNRGIGLSDAPLGPYSIRGMAEDAVAVLEAAGETSAHVMGASMGGMIAQELTLRYPERVRSLLLGCTWCGGLRAILPDVRNLRALRTENDGTPAGRMRALVPLMYTDHTPIERIEEDIGVRLNSPTLTRAYLAQLLGTLTWQSWSRLPRIKQPVQIVHGECDRLIPVANADLLAKRIPNASAFIVPGAGHVFMTDEPELTNRVVLDFLLNVAHAERRDTADHPVTRTDDFVNAPKPRSSNDLERTLER